MKNLSPLTKRKLRIIVWTMVYFVIGLNLYSINRYWGHQGSVEEFTHDTFVATLGGLLGGALMGFIHNFWLERKLRGRSWGRIILIEAFISITIIIIVFLPLTSLAKAFFYNLDAEESFYYNYNYMLTLGFLSLVVYLLILSAGYNGLLLINRQFGKGIMRGLMTGKYIKPIQEKRIFMFLDLKSSTPIAEKLGHIRYSQFIQQCFRDLADVAINHNAQIYQYVGDEAVLTWPVDIGIKDNQCVHLYFEYCKMLLSQKYLYMKKFGIVPEFTASLHAGGVTVAEVGVYKREIAYHGDVLNTASRIQGMCGELACNILVSKNMIEMLSLDEGLNAKDLGETQVKGRSKAVHLFHITKPLDSIPL